MEKWIWNPKVKDSGIIECIPQKGLCPNKCEDCFFQTGRSYLEPLKENLPHIPSVELAQGRIVRVNDGNDSNNQRDLVEKVAQQFDNYFFNTSVPYKLEDFSAPVVLTVNPGKLTDIAFRMINPIPKNLMFVRIRTNTWNLETVVKSAINFYTSKKVVVVITFMAYYTLSIPKECKKDYIWKQRTINSYWCLKEEKIDEIMNLFKDNPYVYSCGIKGQYLCKFCGNCLRTYFETKERMRNGKAK